MIMNSTFSTRKALFYMIKQKNGASDKDLANFLDERRYVGKSKDEKAKREYMMWNIKNGYKA